MIQYNSPCAHTSRHPVYIEVCLSVPPLLPGDFCDTRVLGTRGDDAFSDFENLDGALDQGLCQRLNKRARVQRTFHVSWSNSKTNCLLVRPSSYSCWVGFSAPPVEISARAQLKYIKYEQIFGSPDSTSRLQLPSRIRKER